MFIILLAVSIMVRNALLTRRRRRLLPLLTKEASGPYFTTKVDKDGIILPDVSYSSKLDPVSQTGDSGDTNNTQTHKSKIFLLNPLELMNIPIMKSESEDKKIIDVEDQPGQREQRREPEESESAMTVSCVGGVEPLAAPYQAGRLVSQVRTFTIIFLTELFFFSCQVWQGRHQLQQLYRYSQIDRLVLPPGYVNHNTWA